MRITDVEAVLSSLMGSVIEDSNRTTIADVHAGTVFCIPGAELAKTRHIYVESLVRNPPGCPGKTHINGSQCWDNCSRVSIIRHA